MELGSLRVLYLILASAKLQNALLHRTRTVDFAPDLLQWNHTTKRSLDSQYARTDGKIKAITIVDLGIHLSFVL